MKYDYFFFRIIIIDQLKEYIIQYVNIHDKL